jgi:hypothetical protein
MDFSGWLWNSKAGNLGEVLVQNGCVSTPAVNPLWDNDETPLSTGGTNTFARGCPWLQCAVLAACIGPFALANTMIYGEPGLETRL